MATLLYSFFPNNLVKKVNRLVKKIYETEEAVYHHLVERDLMGVSNSELFAVGDSLNPVGYFTVTLATGCNVGGCETPTENAYEFFYMLVAFDTDAKIKKVRILEYDSEYGYEIMAPGWLKQFEKNKKDILQFEQDIDAISGATKSAKSVVNEVNIISEYLRRKLNKESTEAPAVLDALLMDD